MFRASLCPSSGEKTCVIARGTVRTVTFTVLAPHNTVPHNRYQPHPAEPAQHTTCSNTRLVLLKMCILMPETCWESIDNEHLTVASCWFSLSLHNLLTIHGHRKLKLGRCFWWLHIQSGQPYVGVSCMQRGCDADALIHVGVLTVYIYIFIYCEFVGLDNKRYF